MATLFLTTIPIEGIGCSLYQRNNPNISDNTILDVLTFGRGIKRVDLSFYYRSAKDKDWESNPTILASNAYYINNNTLYGLPCSKNGTLNSIVWDYSEDNLTWGSECQIKIDLRPVPLLFSYFNGYTFIESILGSGQTIVENIHSGKIIGIDNENNFIEVTDSDVILHSESEGSRILKSGLSTPVYVVNKDDGNYIILEQISGSLTEVDSIGTVIKSISGGSKWSNPKFFTYNKNNGNILISGGDVPKVYEITWDNVAAGTVLWKFGHAISGSASGYLNSPSGLCYSSWNKDIVIIADTGNKRIVMVDRTLPETVTNIDKVYFENGSIEVQLEDVLTVSSYGNYIQILEKNGVQKFFNTLISSHPAMARSLNLNVGSQDSLTEYRNLVFSPLLRGAE